MDPHAITFALSIWLAAPQIYYSSDLHRFPDAEATVHAVEFARAYASEVNACPPLWTHQQQDWYAHQKECTLCAAPWWSLRLAHESQGESRKYYLDVLRAEIGEEAWWAGEMPPNVPTWRFCRR